MTKPTVCFQGMVSRSVILETAGGCCVRRARHGLLGPRSLRSGTRRPRSLRVCRSVSRSGRTACWCRPRSRARLCSRGTTWQSGRDVLQTAPSAAEWQGAIELRTRCVKDKAARPVTIHTRAESPNLQDKTKTEVPLWRAHQTEQKGGKKRSNE
jgi:hypothetical protein